MNEVIGKLLSGLSRAVALAVGQFLETHNIITAADDQTVQTAVAVVVTGVIWAGIHWVEDKIKAKKTE